MARGPKNRQPAPQTGTSSRSSSGSGGAAAPAKKTMNPFKFFTQVRQEGRKVTWTSRQETVVSTILVLIMAVIAAIFFFAVDSFIGWIVNMLLSLGA